MGISATPFVQPSVGFALPPGNLVLMFDWTNRSKTMTCHCTDPLTCSTGRFFSLFARRYRRRYAKKGFEPSQRQLLEGITRAGFSGARVLEIGSGVGYLHQHLLRKGAASAVGIDMAARMLEEARAAAVAENLDERVRYVEGDFVSLAPEVEPADVVVLDKVICCYPDVRQLVPLSLARAAHVYAFTLPRNRLINRLGVRVMGFLFWLVRSPFRNYVHDPEMIDGWIVAAGFRRTYEGQTLLWLTRVYRRDIVPTSP